MYNLCQTNDITPASPSNIIPISNSNDNTQQTPVSILALGGSITYGALLEARSMSYPFHIIPAKSIVKNIAVRATGTDFASNCIESMIKNGEQYYHSDHNHDRMITDEEYSVILLEYSLNGIEYLVPLLYRLRKRYPNALIIYIHLWSPRMMIEDEQTNQLLKNDVMNPDNKLTFKQMDQKFNEIIADESIHWKWNKAELQKARDILDKATNMVQSVNGIVWTYPLESNPKSMIHLFSHDFHHLNEDGHKFIAGEVREILREHSLITDKGWLMTNSNSETKKSSGSWGKGDQCYNWFETGQSPLEHKGGVLKRFVKPDKFAHEITLVNGTASITFENKSPWPLPLKVMHMVWTEDKYPKAKVTIDAQQNNDNGSSSITSILNPIHPREGMRMWHITYLSVVGVVQPGWNTLSIDCLETRLKPLRIIGIAMCGDCDYQL